MRQMYGVLLGAALAFGASSAFVDAKHGFAAITFAILFFTFHLARAVREDT